MQKWYVRLCFSVDGNKGILLTAIMGALCFWLPFKNGLQCNERENISALEAVLSQMLGSYNFNFGARPPPPQELKPNSPKILSKSMQTIGITSTV